MKPTLSHCATQSARGARISRCIRSRPTRARDRSRRTAAGDALAADRMTGVRDRAAGGPPRPSDRRARTSTPSDSRTNARAEPRNPLGPPNRRRSPPSTRRGSGADCRPNRPNRRNRRARPLRAAPASRARTICVDDFASPAHHSELTRAAEPGWPPGNRNTRRCNLRGRDAKSKPDTGTAPALRRVALRIFLSLALLPASLPAADLSTQSPPLSPTPAQTEGPFYRTLPADRDADLVQVVGRPGRAQGTVLYFEGRVLTRDGRPARGCPRRAVAGGPVRALPSRR